MRSRNGFTLIEVLVVVAIIALLISILLPSLVAAREQSKRVTCAARLRTLAQVTHMYASSDKLGYFPDLHDAATTWGTAARDNTYPYPYWYSYRALNTFMKRYKLVRDSFYCPSNPDWWRSENHWEIEKGKASVLGYVYFGNFQWGNDLSYMASHDITWFPPPAPDDRRPITANKNTDKPQRDVLWADLTRSQQQGTVRTLDFKSGGNHVKGIVRVGPDGKLKLPARGGANVGFVDSHVEWRNSPAMKHHFQRGLYDIFW